MAAAVIMTAAGCSRHDSDLDVEHKEIEEALEQYQKEQETGGAEDKVPDPNAPEVEVVMIYYPEEGDMGLKKELSDVPELDDYELTQKLIEFKLLPEGAEVINYDPENRVLEYTSVSGLTPVQSMAVLNTFIENCNLDGVWELKIDGETVMKSAFCSDYDQIDDDYTGNEDADSAVSVGGPGVE